MLYGLQQKSASTSDFVAGGEMGETKAEVESAMEYDVKEPETKQVVTSELKKLQFYGAGPKTALPDETGNDAPSADDEDNDN